MTTITQHAELVSLVRAASDAALAEPTVSSGPRLIVGIAGSPGAGKTTIGRRLVAGLGSDAHLLSMDGFHLPQARLVQLGRRERMGAPDTFDVAGFVAVLHRLRAGGAVHIPGFDRELEETIPAAGVVTPGIRIMVVEGNYLLVDDAESGWGEVAPLLDLSFFVGIDPDLRLRRLIARHERYGKSPAEATAWSLGPDAANAEFVDRTAPRADHLLHLG